MKSMKFTVSSAVLAQNLSTIGGLVTRNPVVPILENFLIQVDHNNLIVTASDLQTSVSIQMGVESDIEVSIAVPAKMLLDTVKNLPDQMITLEIDPESYHVIIHADHGYYKLLGENADDFPRFTKEEDQGTELVIPVDDFKNVLQRTIFATSQNELKPAMCGVYMDFGPSAVTFVATDGHRLVRYIHQDLSVEVARSVIVPKKSLLFLNAILSSKAYDVVLKVYRSTICFQYGAIVMTTNLVDERYPDYQAVIPSLYTSQLVVDRMALVHALRRIMIYANKATHQIKFTLSANRLDITAEDLEFSSEAHETLLGIYQGENLEIGFNVKLLLEMLTNTGFSDVVFSFLEPHKAVLMMPKEPLERQDILLLIMPIVL